MIIYIYIYIKKNLLLQLFNQNTVKTVILWNIITIRGFLISIYLKFSAYITPVNVTFCYRNLFNALIQLIYYFNFLYVFYVIIVILFSLVMF